MSYQCPATYTCAQYENKQRATAQGDMADIIISY